MNGNDRIQLNSQGQPNFESDEVVRDRWHSLSVDFSNQKGESWSYNKATLFLTKKRWVIVNEGADTGTCFPIDSSLSSINKIKKRSWLSEKYIGNEIIYESYNIKLESKSKTTLKEIKSSIESTLEDYEKDKKFLLEKERKKKEYEENSFFTSSVLDKLDEEGDESVQAVANGFSNIDAMKDSLQSLLLLANELKDVDQEAEDFVDDVEVKNSLYVSRKVSKDNFFVDLAKSINHFYCEHMKDTDNGMIPMIDFYCDYNTSQGGTDVKTPLEMLRTKPILREENLECRIKTINGMEVLVHEEKAKQFEESIQQLINKEMKGFTVLELSKKFKVSLVLIRSILEQAEIDGLLCREERPNGIYYWQNIFQSSK